MIEFSDQYIAKAQVDITRTHLGNRYIGLAGEIGSRITYHETNKSPHGLCMNIYHLQLSNDQLSNITIQQNHTHPHSNDLKPRIPSTTSLSGTRKKKKKITTPSPKMSQQRIRPPLPPPKKGPTTRTLAAVFGAVTLAGLLFIYGRSSIQAAKRNAKAHREADGGQINWHNENLRRHGVMMGPTPAKGTVRELVDEVRKQASGEVFVDGKPKK